MRWQAALVVMVLLFAGCASREKTSSEPESPMTTSPAPTTAAAAVPEQPKGTGGFTWLEIDAANLTYNSSLERFLIRAGPGGANVSLTIDGRIPSYTADDDCLAVAVHPELAKPSSGNMTNGTVSSTALMGVFWTYKNNAGYSRVRAGGQEQEVDLFKTLGGEADGGGDLSVSAELFTSLKPGEALRIDIGGRNGRMLHGVNQLTPSHFVVNITAIGEVLFGVDEPAPLSCGTGLFQLRDADVSVTNGIGTVMSGGSIAFDSMTASTLLFQTGRDELPREARLSFLDETIPVGTDALEVSRTSNGPGRLGFEVESWTNEFPSDPNWFFADAYWPVLESE